MKRKQTLLSWVLRDLTLLAFSMILLGILGCSSLPTKLISKTTVSVASPTSSTYTLVLPEGGKLTSVARPELAPVLTTSKKRFEVTLKRHDPSAEFVVLVNKPGGVEYRFKVDQEKDELVIVVDRDSVKLAPPKD